jgi:hypothetical protein
MTTNVPQDVIDRLLEADNFGQFSEDFDQPLAKPIRNDIKALLNLLRTQRQQGSEPVATLQERIAPWMQECFGPVISEDKLERGDRFLEESLELLQSGDYPKDRVYALIEYVYNRPKGEPSQEVGGVMITLGAYCLAHKLDMHEAGEVELARINQPLIIEKIRAKQKAKPTGSALPIATPPQANALVAAAYRDAAEIANQFEATCASKKGLSPLAAETARLIKEEILAAIPAMPQNARRWLGSARSRGWIKQYLP